MKDKVKLLVAGGRDFLCYPAVEDSINSWELDIGEIVTGKAKGTDYLGEVYARQYIKGLVEFPADWNHYGRLAGYIRNEEMAKVTDYALIFWDGESKGTANMIENCVKYKVPFRIIYYSKTEYRDMSGRVKEVSYTFSCDKLNKKYALERYKIV